MLVRMPLYCCSINFITFVLQILQTQKGHHPPAKCWFLWIHLVVPEEHWRCF